VGQLSGRDKRLKARGLRNLLENKVISPFALVVERMVMLPEIAEG
jgi:hypothetical protein